MVIKETIHKLSKDEISILRQLIGKSLTAITCSGADLTSGNTYYDFTDTVNLKFQADIGFISISAIFDETSFGDDFIKVFISKEKKAISNNQLGEVELKHPLIHLNVNPNFIIRKIEVYGESYVCESDNLESERYWKIEIENPGQSIIENIETENAILFYSDKHRLLIRPYGPISWIQATFDKKFIDDSLIHRSLEGNIITRLKYTLI